MLRKVASPMLLQYSLGPNRYGSLQLCIKASFRAHVAEDKLNFLLPHDEAAMKLPTDFTTDYLYEPLTRT